MILQNLVYELEPIKDFILASEVSWPRKSNLIFLQKLCNLISNIAEKGLRKISRISYKIEPFKEIILTSEVKGHFLKKLRNLMKIIAEKVWLKPFKDFILASEAKFDLRGQRSWIKIWRESNNNVMCKIW